MVSISINFIKDSNKPSVSVFGFSIFKEKCCFFTPQKWGNDEQVRGKKEQVIFFYEKYSYSYLFLVEKSIKQIT